eukprot:1159823-Pelagomonas_calceolata.AAC.1
MSSPSIELLMVHGITLTLDAGTLLCAAPVAKQNVKEVHPLCPEAKQTPKMTIYFAARPPTTDSKQCEVTRTYG